MARGGLDWEGIGYRGATYKAANALVSVVTASGVAAVEGKAVTITGDGEVGFGSNGDTLLGKLDKYESDNYVTVQDAGYTSIPGVSGSLPSAGNFLVVNGSGAVKASTGAVGPARAVSIGTAATGPVVVLLC